MIVYHRVTMISLSDLLRFFSDEEKSLLRVQPNMKFAGSVNIYMVTASSTNQRRRCYIRSGLWDE